MMIKKTTGILMSLGILVATQSVYAQDDATSMSESRYSASELRDRILPAVDLSYGYLDQGGKVDADGDGISIMAVGTHYFRKSFWLADLGIGFHQQNLDKDNGDQALGIVAVSARYRFPHEWSLGPTATGFIGNAEPFGRDDHFTGMVGAVGFKEFMVRQDQILRVGIRYTTDVATSNQTSNFIGLALELTAPRIWYNRTANTDSYTSL